MAQKTYNSEYGAQDLLALVQRARARRRFHSSDLVGSGRDHSDRIHLVVAGLPQRLVRVSPNWETFHVHERNGLLAPNFLVEKVGHDLKCLGCLGKVEVVPKRVRERLKDNQLRIVTCMQQGTMKRGRITQEEIARAGDEKGRRHAAQVGEEGREDRVLAIGFAHVRIVG